MAGDTQAAIQAGAQFATAVRQVVCGAVPFANAEGLWHVLVVALPAARGTVRKIWGKIHTQWALALVAAVDAQKSRVASARKHARRVGPLLAESGASCLLALPLVRVRLSGVRLHTTLALAGESSRVVRPIVAASFFPHPHTTKTHRAGCAMLGDRALDQTHALATVVARERPIARSLVPYIEAQRAPIASDLYGAVANLGPGLAGITAVA
jgi:hypothetical protein